MSSSWCCSLHIPVSPSTSQKAQLLLLALMECCLVMGSAFQTLGIAAGGPRVLWDWLQILLEPWHLGLEQVGNSFGSP